jgi:hypothetical protein
LLRFPLQQRRVKAATLLRFVRFEQTAADTLDALKAI